MIKGKTTTFLNMIFKEMQSNKYKLVQNTTKNKQSSVSAIFRIKPDYINSQILDLSKQLYKPLYVGENQQLVQNNIISYNKVKHILDELEQSTQNQDNLELLFIQRASNPKDRHSGQIAFPGGHVDNQENDFQAGIREIHEEIGVDLSKDSDEFYQFYLGKLPQSLFARKNKNGMNLYVNTHFFFLVQKQKNSEITFKLQQSELQDLKFVDFSILLFPTQNTLYMLRWGNSKYIIQFFPKFIRNVIDNQLKNIDYVEYPAINIGMGQPLWGLTLALVNYKFQMLLTQNKKLEANQQYDLKSLKGMVDTPVINPKWKNNYKYAGLVNFCIQYFNRRNQSATYLPYKKQQNDYSRVHLFMSMILAYYYIPIPSL